ncbi:MAG: flavocytochrome C, partial [Betaproteobacteria bacterium]
DDKEVAHIASVHRYEPAKKSMVVVTGSGGRSPRANTEELPYADAWARNIWADTLA